MNIKPLFQRKAQSGDFSLRSFLYGETHVYVLCGVSGAIDATRDQFAFVEGRLIRNDALQITL
jgi:tRNA U34 5-carboxymethylaminomethyl modifying GTPase MnmE/TrmE